MYFFVENEGAWGLCFFLFLAPVGGSNPAGLHSNLFQNPAWGLTLQGHILTLWSKPDPCNKKKQEPPSFFK